MTLLFSLFNTKHLKSIGLFVKENCTKINVIFTMATFTLEQFTLKFREKDGKAYFTVSDLKSLPEWPESPLLELIKGELYLMPSPNTNHQNIAGELFFQIKSFLKSNSVGFVFTAPIDVVFSEEDTVIPDIIFISKNNEKIITSQNIQGSPDFIIEVVSSNQSRDFIQKRNYLISSFLFN
jgi:Uma2 family endonuclease